MEAEAEVTKKDEARSGGGSREKGLAEVVILTLHSFVCPPQPSIQTLLLQTQSSSSSLEA